MVAAQSTPAADVLWEFGFLPALSHEIEDRSGSGVINDEVGRDSGSEGSQQADGLGAPSDDAEPARYALQLEGS